MKNKILLSALAVILIGGVAVLNTNKVQAQTNNNPFSKLVQMIATKFGLDQNQVQSVFDQFHQDQKQNRVQMMQDKQKKRLDKLVQQGKITSAQEQTIIDEFASLKNKYSNANLKNMTPKERKAQFQSMQNELNSWAKSQGIDPTYLMPGFGMGGLKRGSGMFKRGQWPTPTASAK